MKAGILFAAGQLAVFSTLLILFFISIAFFGFNSNIMAQYDYSRLATADSGVLAALEPITANATSTLLYDLTVDLSFRNRHALWPFIWYYDIAAAAFYNGTMLGLPDSSLPTPFKQAYKNTTVWRTVFRGMVAVYSSVAAEAERERAAGMMHVHVRVSVTLALRAALRVADKLFPFDFDCWLWFPPPRRGAPGIFDAAGTRCSPKSHFIN